MPVVTVISSYRAIPRRGNVNALAQGSDMMGGYVTRVAASREAEFDDSPGAWPIRVATPNRTLKISH